MSLVNPLRAFLKKKMSNYLVKEFEVGLLPQTLLVVHLLLHGLIDLLVGIPHDLVQHGIPEEKGPEISFGFGSLGLS